MLSHVVAYGRWSLTRVVATGGSTVCTLLRALLGGRAQGALAQHNTFLCKVDPTLRIARALSNTGNPSKKGANIFLLASKAIVGLPVLVPTTHGHDN